MVRPGSAIEASRTWTAIDADSKLCISWLVGTREADTALEFMDDVAYRLQYRVQLTTDGHRAYLTAVDEVFGGEIDYAMLYKSCTASRVTLRTLRRVTAPASAQASRSRR